MSKMKTIFCFASITSMILLDFLALVASNIFAIIFISFIFRFSFLSLLLQPHFIRCLIIKLTFFVLLLFSISKVFTLMYHPSLISFQVFSLVVFKQAFHLLWKLQAFTRLWLFVIESLQIWFSLEIKDLEVQEVLEVGDF